MSSPSQPAASDFNLESAAVIEWIADDNIHRLSNPDPQRDNITLETCFTREEPAVSFKLRIPVYLKGIKYKSHIIIIINPKSIVSFDYKHPIEVHSQIREKLNGGVIALNFQIYRSIDIVVPATITSDNLTPQRPSSGKIQSLQDEVRSLRESRDISAELDSLYGRTDGANSFAENRD